MSCHLINQDRDFHRSRRKLLNNSIERAFIVLRTPPLQSEDLARELQDYVKQAIAPYKYPRAVEFVPELPKTESGKIQRSALRVRG